MNIFVYTENWDGKFKKLSFELVSYAYAMAKEYNSQVIVASIGNVDENELKNLGNYGASKVISVSSPLLQGLDNKVYTNVLHQIATAENADIILLAHNNTGKALAARLSAKMKAGLVTAVNALPAGIDPFVVSKKAFTGKAFAHVKVNTKQKVLTLSQNAFGVFENVVNCSIENFQPQINESDITTSIKDVNKITGKVLLNDAEVVVSAGRGMKGAENWQPIEELAEILGGATACTRPVSDEGWRPHAEHTGQTGKIIAPNLYFAFGISGAIQHVAGISSSKVIVAVNKDPEAPIFEVADYGIVGDVFKVLPELVSEVKKLKAGS